MRRKLGELLIEAGAVSREDVDAALSDQSAGEPSRLGDLLLSTGKCTPNALARALAAQHEMPFADLSYVAPEASGLIPIEFQRAHRIVPFRLDREGGATRVHIAIADPTITDVVDELRSQLKREIVVHVAPIDDIENVHLALSGEGAEEPVVMGEVLEDEVYAPPPEAAVVGEATFDFPAAPEPVATTDSGLGAFDFPAAPQPATDSGPSAFDFPAAPEPAAPDLSAFDFPAAPEPAAPDLSAFDFPAAPEPAAPDLSAFDFPAAPEAAAAPGPFEFPAPPEPAVAAPFDFPPAPTAAPAPFDPGSAPEPEITVENPLPGFDFHGAAAAPAVDLDPFSFDEPTAPAPAPIEAAPAIDVDEFGFPEPSAPDASAFGAPSADLGAEAPAAPVPPAPSVTEADLFGELDLPAATADAPLSTALADEIGRHDQAPPMQESVGFSALSPPLGDPDDRFGARASSPLPVPPPSDPAPLKPERPLTAPEPPPSVPMPEPAPLLDAEVVAPAAAEPALDLPSIVPAPLVSPLPDVEPVVHESTQKFAGNTPAGVPKIPSFAIPPDVPVEPRRSPVEPLRRPAALGRIALKRVAVNRAGEAVEVPQKAAPPPPPPPVPAPIPEPVAAEAAAPDLALPDWMQASTDAAPPVLAPVPSGQLGPALVALLTQVESGALPPGPVLAAVLRLLVEHRVVDDADVSAVLEKLK